ncbi:MAG: hypothetical protein RLZZ282_1549, partial [Verrucomicrobiota bacterium]
VAGMPPSSDGKEAQGDGHGQTDFNLGNHGITERTFIGYCDGVRGGDRPAITAVDVGAGDDGARVGGVFGGAGGVEAGEGPG